MEFLVSGGFYGIKNWPVDEKPRERLQQKGVASLSDAELIAVLIRCGTERTSAMDLARLLLNRVGDNLLELARLSVEELQQTHGIGVAKAASVAAALELGRRRQLGEALARPLVRSSRDAADVVMPMLCGLHYEVFCALYLNQGNRVVSHELISSGGLTGTVADIRVILKKALLSNAAGLILAHNHPSGNLQPSRADGELTHRVREAASYMDIRLLDHLIVSDSGFLSMSDEGMI